MSKVHTALWAPCLYVITSVMLVICAAVVQSIRTDTQIHYQNRQLSVHLPNIILKLDDSDTLFITAAKECYQPSLIMINHHLFYFLGV